MKTPDLPEEKPSAADKRDYISTAAVDYLVGDIKSRIQAGEIIGALDYCEPDRALFWAAIARVRDDLPGVKTTWRTVSERHVDGLRTRQKLFKICPREHADGLAAASRADRWRAAQRAALEIPICGTPHGKHKAISDLLAQLSSLLGSAGRK